MKFPTILLTAIMPALLSAAAPVEFDWFVYTGRDDVFATPLPAGSYRNPILAGYYPDPSICRVSDDYYLINSTFAHFPGIPVFHSRDLVNWRQIGHVIDRPTQLNYDKIPITRGLFAPAISHHGDTFYVVCTLIDRGGNFLVTAKDPAGPWSDPVWLNFDGIDPSLFFDDDGRAWLVNNGNPPDNKPLYQGHRAIWVQEFDFANKKLIGPRSIIVNGGVDLAKKPCGSRARTSTSARAGITCAAPRAAPPGSTRRSSSAASRPPALHPVGQEPDPDPARSRRRGTARRHLHRPRRPRDRAGRQLVVRVPRLPPLRPRPLGHGPRNLSPAGDLDRRRLAPDPPARRACAVCRRVTQGRRRRPPPP